MHNVVRLTSFLYFVCTSSCSVPGRDVGSKTEMKRHFQLATLMAHES